MDIKFAKLCNHTNNPSNPDNSQFEMKGQKGVCCLAEGYNTPNTDSKSIGTKVISIIVPSFMKRPSLSSEAMNAIFERANSGVLTEQTPQYPTVVSASAIFFIKNKFVYASAGDNVIFHFVNGKIVDVFSCDPGEEPPCLGLPDYSSPRISDPLAFGKGENTFLICTRKFAEAISDEVLEDTLAHATHYTQKGNKKVSEVKCDKWLKALKGELPDFNGDDPYSAIAVSMPPRKKKPVWVIILIAVLALIAALLIANFAFRLPIFSFIFRTGGPGQGGPGQGGPGQGGPGQGGPGNGDMMVGPNGETAPMPPQGGQGGQPGQQPSPPTRPPKDDSNEMNQNAPANSGFDYTSDEIIGDIIG
ncbi:MAG: hypothetical protein IJJ15_00385 [Ruminococcus sp.]|nr:hypothetical protein [Ruminococcus sp.]